VHVGQLDGRVAVITGSTTGIGFAIAKALFGEGASVVLNGRNEETGAKARQELGDPDRSVFVAADVRSREGVDSLVAAAVEQFGTLDIMVNNAGGLNATAPVVDMTDEVWDDAIKWNLYATFWGTRAALKVLIPKRSGRIINISSVEGKHGKPGIAGYVTAKHAINGLTKSVAKEVGELGITCNALCPGLIITEVVKRTGPESAAAMGLTYEGMIELFCADSAIKRPNTVEEVAATALLLCTDVAAGITGAMWSIDGGTAAV